MTKEPLYKSGDRYDMLMLTGKSFFVQMGKRKRRAVECICDCGKVIYPLLESVRGMLVKSCGCRKAIMNTTHGLSKRNNRHPIYQAWRGMIDRCYNEKCAGFANWGGRGIIICEAWRREIELFYEWSINNGWRKGLSIDRINNDGNYEPSNCRWTTRFVQHRNRSDTHLITAFNETKCLKDWYNDERCIVSKDTVYKRIKKGWEPERVFSAPPTPGVLSTI